ncbi:PREDICTED: thioredoxin-related transmembrane protein 2 [Tarenaya hassleriana]|uniref:thioredoxin-related transmembrane protein 2 n=1 Tax=Tarenaya hassleriana TaxID=28532 RepID=UPI00053CA54B|nr:PREDICTED: thioredoxin-related transmembrane protein 2 [Tarenaya hassleriana]
MVQKREGRIKWLNRMVSEPYYFLHFIAFFSYLPIRSSASPYVSDRLLDREIQAFLALMMLSAVKMVREETWEAFIADILFYAKIFLIAVSLITDYRLALWYSVAFSVIYLLALQPAFDKLGTAKKLTPLQLEELLSEGNTTTCWLIEFYASTSSAFVRSSRCFPELSITYSNDILSFGIVDLGLFPNVAAKFGISLAGGMSQLPTYILFEKGTEVSRFPDFYVEATPSLPITKKLLCQHFELDRLLLDYVKGS